MTLLLIAFLVTAGVAQERSEAVSPPKPVPPGAAAPLQPPAPSRGEEIGPPQAEPTRDQNKSDAYKRGTEQSPPAVKAQPTTENGKETADSASKKQEIMVDRWRTDIMTGIVAFASAAQAIALIFTIFVMIRTARRQLRSYIIIERIYRDGPHREIPVFHILVHRLNRSGHRGHKIIQRNHHLMKLPGESSVCAAALVKNVGQTPAYRVTVSASIGPADKDVTSIINIGYAVSGLPRDQMIGSQGTIDVKAEFNGGWGEGGHAAFLAGNRKLFLTGEIRYVDAFKRRRFTRFALEYTADNIGDGRVTFCASGNNAN
jgi:hypothetical protein